MKRSDMICKRCIKFDGENCRSNPAPVLVDNPESEWCAQGTWHQWSERYQEMEPYYWGEWHDVA